MSDDFASSFRVTKKQYAKFKKWEKEQDAKVIEKQGGKYPNYGAIGGAYTFSFSPTTVGTVFKATNSLTGETIDLSFYEDW